MEIGPAGASIILMLKNSETGFLEDELAQYSIGEDDVYFERLFAEGDPEKGLQVHMRLSTDPSGRELTDKEYEDILEAYEFDRFAGLAEVSEVDDCVNPTWEFSFSFLEDERKMEGIIKDIIARHREELAEALKSLDAPNEELR
ncbi:MAG: hypothetical protein LBU32_14955 [Clostridiales bacterium]|nr:hypothetical protein [Clostridiales bacterium]